MSTGGPPSTRTCLQGLYRTQRAKVHLLCVGVAKVSLLDLGPAQHCAPSHQRHSHTGVTNRATRSYLQSRSWLLTLGSCIRGVAGGRYRPSPHHLAGLACFSAQIFFAIRVCAEMLKTVARVGRSSPRGTEAGFSSFERTGRPWSAGSVRRRGADRPRLPGSSGRFAPGVASSGSGLGWGRAPSLGGSPGSTVPFPAWSPRTL